MKTVGKGPQDFIQEMLLSSQEAVLWPRRLPPHEVPAEGARVRDSPHPPGFRSQKSSEQTDTAGHVTVLRTSEEARVTQGLVSSRTPHPGLASSVSCWSLTASVRTVWGELSTSCPRAHCECGWRFRNIQGASHPPHSSKDTDTWSFCPMDALKSLWEPHPNPVSVSMVSPLHSPPPLPGPQRVLSSSGLFYLQSPPPHILI